MRLSLKRVKARLLKEPISSLGPEELSLYCSYRLSRLLGPRIALSTIELQYLLCETGPGGLRFDPEMLDFLLEDSDVIEGKVRRRRAGRNSYWVWALGPEDYVDMVVARKQQLVNRVTSKATRVAVMESLAERVEVSARDAGYADAGAAIRGELIEATMSRSGFLVHLYPNRWVLPHSTELWSLVKKAKVLGLDPVLLARKAHGICYPLFKSVGVFGQNTYSLYLPDETAGAVREFNARKQDYSFLRVGFTPGNVVSVSCDEAIAHFFDEVLPKHHRVDDGYVPENELRVLTTRASAATERLQACARLADGLPNQKVRRALVRWLGQRIALLGSRASEKSPAPG